MPARRFELDEYRAVIAAANSVGLDLVLVGGQAVSYYAAYYLLVCPQLSAFLPFLSKDADLLSMVDDGRRLARAMNVSWAQNPRKGGLQGLLLGYLSLPGNSENKIEILGRVLGADAATIRASAYTAEIPGGRLRIVNPFLLYIVKGNNFAQLAQREPGRERQDGRQFAMMELVVGTILQQFVGEPSSESARALVKTCGRLIEFWPSQDVASLVRAGAANPSKILPSEAMQRHENQSVRNLVEKRLPVFFEQQLPVAKRTASTYLDQMPPGSSVGACQRRRQALSAEKSPSEFLRLSDVALMS